MKVLICTLLILLFTSCNSKNQSSTMEEKKIAPVCKINPKTLTIHGDTRTDNYYWLNQRDNKEVIDYLNEENSYSNFILKNTQNLQDSLYEEMRGRIKEDDSSVPFFSNDYYYCTKFNEGSEHPIYTRKKT